MTMNFGKFKGVAVAELPDDYLRWLSTIGLYGELLDAVRMELRWRRSGTPSLQLSAPRELQQTMIEVVDRGYRACARIDHPDAGGDGERMLKLNAAVAILRAALIPTQ